ncbi:MAG: hypothetical protein AAB800_02020 [Patescibacteria group bacterium]
MELGIPDGASPVETPEQKRSIGEKVSAAGKRVIDHFRSDSVVRAGDEAAVRIIREVKPEMDEQAVSQAAARFHVVAQGAGVAATAGDIALTVAFAGWSGLFLKDIGMKPFQPPAGSKAEAVLGGSSHSPLKNNLPPGLAFGGAAAGIAVFRPARAFLTLLGKGIGWGGEKTARIISRITHGI